MTASGWALPATFSAYRDPGTTNWASRAPSTRAIRHLWLTDLIGVIHAVSNRTYGRLRVQCDFEYIAGFHNRRRRHSALGWRTPLKFEIAQSRQPNSSLTCPRKLGQDQIVRETENSQRTHVRKFAKAL